MYPIEPKLSTQKLKSWKHLNNFTHTPCLFALCLLNRSPRSKWDCAKITRIDTNSLLSATKLMTENMLKLRCNCSCKFILHAIFYGSIHQHLFAYASRKFFGVYNCKCTETPTLLIDGADDVILSVGTRKPIQCKRRKKNRTNGSEHNEWDAYSAWCET